MSKTRHTPKHRHSDSAHFWQWRDLNRRLQLAKTEDNDRAELFSQQASEVREEINFLLSNGLSEGAEAALTAFAEEDMVNFCIMVDLAESINIPNVDPLDGTLKQHLQNFLEQEPWHSLAIDNDITVALALLDSVGAHTSNRPWYERNPGLFDVLVKVLDRVNKEQLIRFVGEFNALAARDGLHLPAEATKVFGYLVAQASQRLNMPFQELKV